jgi:hypothetical protein
MRVTTCPKFWAILACMSASFLAGTPAAIGQNTGCVRTVSPNGTVTETCPGTSPQYRPPPSYQPQFPNNPPPVDHGGPPIRMRFGIQIPTCAYGKAYSVEHQQCIPAQNLGGVIPCSQDDTTYVPSRGYVPNCR